MDAIRSTPDDLALNGGQPCRSKPYPWPIHGDAEKQLLLEVLESGRWAFEGPKEAELSRTLASYLRTKYAILVSSGTVALEIAIQAVGLGPGDEVVLPALTWTAPARAIVNAGALPVFVDVNPSDWCIDPDAIERAITPHTRAVLVVHTYSQMADMDRILAIASKYDLCVVEDCAHAHGAEWRRCAAGTLGAVGCFSFQLSKAMTAGEGGLVVTSDRAIADRLYSLKNCGRRRTPESDIGFGGNYRMTEFQAAVLLGQLARLDEQIELKERNVSLFEDGIQRMSGVSHLPLKKNVTRRNFFGLSLRIDTSYFADIPTSLLVTALAAEGMPIFMPHEVLYRSPMWTSGLREPCLGSDSRAERLGLKACCPNAERIATQEGIVVAHEAFLGSADETDQIVLALRKVQHLAHRIPIDAQDRRII